MSLVLQIIANVAVLLLSVVQLAMLVRAVMSWFPMDPNKFTDFLYAVTEPFIYPIRMLFQKMNWFQDIPLDMSFMATYILLSILLLVL